MSLITSLILSFSHGEDEEQFEKLLNQYPNRGSYFNIVGVDSPTLPDYWYGGTKYMSTQLYLGAYNHFDVDDFITYLKALPWERPEHVQLIVKGEWDYKFTFYNIFPDAV